MDDEPYKSGIRTLHVNAILWQNRIETVAGVVCLLLPRRWGYEYIWVHKCYAYVRHVDYSFAEFSSKEKLAKKKTTLQCHCRVG